MTERPPSADEPDIPVEEWLEAYLPQLTGYVRSRTDRLLAARESTSDLVQSVCREVLQHLDRFEHRSEAGFRQWLFKTAERKIIDRYRYHTAERRHPNREDHNELRLLDEALFQTPSQDAVAREELERIQATFAALPPHYQRVIVLARVDGLSHAEIAERVGKSSDAVRNILYRGLATMSLALTGGGEEPGRNGKAEPR